MSVFRKKFKNNNDKNLCWLIGLNRYVIIISVDREELRNYELTEVDLVWRGEPIAIMGG